MLPSTSGAGGGGGLGTQSTRCVNLSGGDPSASTFRSARFLESLSAAVIETALRGGGVGGRRTGKQDAAERLVAGLAWWGYIEGASDVEEET